YKTRIFPNTSEIEIEFEYQESENNLDNNKVAEIITDLLLSNNSEVSEIVQTIERYIQTESDDNKKPPPLLITTKEIYSTIQIVLYYEEQMNSEFSLDLEEL
ncbi:26917_t:CDS:2, partial [Racocetra persica]